MCHCKNFAQVKTRPSAPVRNGSSLVTADESPIVKSEKGRLPLGPQFPIYQHNNKMKLSFFLAVLSIPVVAARMLVAVDEHSSAIVDVDPLGDVQKTTTGRHLHAHGGNMMSGKARHLTKDIGGNHYQVVNDERKLHAHGKGSKGRELHAHHGSGKMGTSGRRLHAHGGGKHGSKRSERYLLDLELAEFSERFFSQRELSTSSDFLSLPGAENDKVNPHNPNKGMDMQRHASVHRGKTMTVGSSIVMDRPIRVHRHGFKTKGQFMKMKRSQAKGSSVATGRPTNVHGHTGKTKGPSMKMERHLHAHGKSVMGDKANKIRGLPNTKQGSNHRNDAA